MRSLIKLISKEENFTSYLPRKSLLSQLKRLLSLPNLLRMKISQWKTQRLRKRKERRERKIQPKSKKSPNSPSLRRRRIRS
jgi:hypothetical protein